MYPVCIKKVLFRKIFAFSLLGFCLLITHVVLYAEIPSPPAPPTVPVPLEEGKQYRRLSIAVTQNPKVQEFIARDPGKTQVIEFFSYACFGCQQLHPVINQWIKDKGSPASQTPVVLYRIPLVFHPTWEPLAKAYYTIKILGLSEQLDAEFFTAVNQQRVNFTTENVLEDFVKVRGVDPQLFMETYRSFGVNRQRLQDAEISLAYQVALSPYFVVNTSSGSFVTSAVMAGSAEGLLNVLNYLITLKPPT